MCPHMSLHVALIDFWKCAWILARWMRCRKMMESEGSDDMDAAVPSPVMIEESPEKPQVQATYACALDDLTLHHVRVGVG